MEAAEADGIEVPSDRRPVIRFVDPYVDHDLWMIHTAEVLNCKPWELATIPLHWIGSAGVLMESRNIIQEHHLEKSKKRGRGRGRGGNSFDHGGGYGDWGDDDGSGAAEEDDGS